MNRRLFMLALHIGAVAGGILGAQYLFALLFPML
jgi:outer membrane lipoprotein SlyB